MGREGLTSVCILGLLVGGMRKGQTIDAPACARLADNTTGC